MAKAPSFSNSYIYIYNKSLPIFLSQCAHKREVNLPSRFAINTRQYKTTSPTSPEINEQAEIKVYGHTNITHTHTQNTHTHTHTHFIDFTVLAEILEARAGVGTGSRTGFAWGRGCQSVGVLLEFSGSSLQKNKKSCLTCSLSTPLKNTAQFRGREVFEVLLVVPPMKRPSSHDECPTTPTDRVRPSVFPSPKASQRRTIQPDLVDGKDPWNLK